jgi:peptidoglycan/LPS O-acetylase OafA/YrhL
VAVAHGCGCASDDTIRWLVVALLGLAGTTTFLARWWWQRRAPTSDVHSPVERSAPVLAGVVIFALAGLVALVPMSSDASLLVLALGATVGTAGCGFAARRTRDGSTAVPQ